MVLLFFGEAGRFSVQSSVSCSQAQVDPLDVFGVCFTYHVPVFRQHFGESRPVVGAEMAYSKLLQLPVEPADRMLAAIAPAPGQHLVCFGRVSVEEPPFALLPSFDKGPHLVYLYRVVVPLPGTDLQAVGLLVEPPEHGLPVHARYLFNVADACVSDKHLQHQALCLGPAARFLIRVLELLSAVPAEEVLPARALYAIFYYFHTVAVGAVYLDSYLAHNFL